MAKRNVRFSVSFTEEEASSLDQHPDNKGSRGDLVRALALQALGFDRPDPYDSHRARARDEKGKLMKTESYVKPQGYPHTEASITLEPSAVEKAIAWAEQGGWGYCDLQPNSALSVCSGEFLLTFESDDERESFIEEHDLQRNVDSALQQCGKPTRYGT